MNKSDLYFLLAKEYDLSLTNAVNVVDVFFDSISNALVNGDRVEIRGLCSWQPKEYEGYSGRNPHTGERIEISQKRLAAFKPGKSLLDILNRDLRSENGEAG